MRNAFILYDADIEIFESIYIYHVIIYIVRVYNNVVKSIFSHWSRNFSGD